MKKRSEKVVVSARTGVVAGVIKSEDLGLDPGGKLTVRTLSGGRQEGVVEIVLDAGDMKLSLLPTRGMGIWWAKYKGKSLFWKSPVREAVHPAHINLERNGGLGWLEGFCEGMARCGMAFNGAPGVDEIIDNTGAVTSVTLPLHGKVANIPASTVTVAGKRRGGRQILSVTGELFEEGVFMDKYRLVSRTDVAIGGSEIAIHDEVTNLSKERTAPLEMLYHINFGGSALGRGSRMVFKGDVCPRDERAAEGLDEHTSFVGRTKGFTEQCYFFDLGTYAGDNTGAMLIAPKGAPRATSPSTSATKKSSSSASPNGNRPAPTNTPPASSPERPSPTIGASSVKPSASSSLLPAKPAASTSPSAHSTRKTPSPP